MTFSKLLKNWFSRLDSLSTKRKVQTISTMVPFALSRVEGWTECQEKEWGLGLNQAPILRLSDFWENGLLLALGGLKFNFAQEILTTFLDILNGR